MADTEISERLMEWGRFVRVRMLQGHCRSIEHRYRNHPRPDDTPTGYGDWLTTPPIVPAPRIEPLRALEIERCMRHLPKRQRKALKLVYVHKMPERWCARRMAVRYAEWPEFLETAHNMVSNLLRRNEIGYKRLFSHLPIPSTRRDPEPREAPGAMAREEYTKRGLSVI